MTYYQNDGNMVAKKGGEVTNDRSLNFKVSAELYSCLKAESERKGISLAALIRVILSAYFEAEK